MMHDFYPDIAKLNQRALDRLEYSAARIKNGPLRSEILAAICELTMIKVKIGEIISIFGDEKQ